MNDTWKGGAPGPSKPGGSAAARPDAAVGAQADALGALGKRVASLEAQLRERDAQLAHIAADHATAWRKVGEAHEHNVYLSGRLAAANEDIAAMRRSLGWRLTAPLRAASRAVRRFRAYFWRGMELVPAHDIKPIGGAGNRQAFEMTGDDPFFELGWRSGRLAPAHYRLAFDTPEGTAALAEPKLYVDSGAGYSEAEALTLVNIGSESRFVARLSLNNGARALRFDPSVKPGRLAIGGVRIRRLSRVEYYAGALLSVIAARRRIDGSIWPSLRSAFAALRAGGVRGAAAALRSNTNRLAQLDLDGRTERKRQLIVRQPRYVPITGAAPLAETPATLVAFYLPQFHPIPENDAWWGEGFTEWTNVRPAAPQFEGQYQPHVPDRLGYYDLREPGVMASQIELARLYGVGAFCFYFYWFAGKRLLETPVEAYLRDETLDLPFCLCWANENWSRRWDGKESEILIAQDHSPRDDIEFIAHVAKYLRDPRYVRIDGRPVLLVYRPSLLPSPIETAARWRKWCRDNGVGEIFLAYTQSFEVADPAAYGFDAAVEFPPNNSAPPNLTDVVRPTGEDFAGNVFDWTIFPERSRNYLAPGYTLFRGVCPGWDNTARRRNRANIFANNSPELFAEWLANALSDTKKRFAERDRRLIFVNAWNEWAEGAHLEPDQRDGFAYLQAVRDTLEKSERAIASAIVLVTHDCHPHGAQFLLLSMARELVAMGFGVSIVALDGGPLLDDFAAVAPTINATAEGATALDAFLERARARGAVDAITNTVVSGAVVGQLTAHGYRILSLIHEMPGVIRQMRQEGNAAAIAASADKVVFAAPLVRDRFVEIAPVEAQRTLVLPQGLLRRNPYKDRREEAHRIVCERHNLPFDTQIVVAVGYVDHRKGPDILVDAARHVLETHPRTAFIWIGHTEREMEKTVRDAIAAHGLEKRVLFPGFRRDPMEYYAAASVYALPSREDPFPNVVLEAAEAGTPVVAFENASGAGPFIEARGGLLARPFDAGDFAARIRQLLDAPPPPRTEPAPSMRHYILDLLHALNGTPRVSVVVPNFNYAHHLVARLKSIAAQTFPPYEVIVLDDASTDASLAAIRAFAAEHPWLDLRIVENEKNSGSVFRQWRKGVELCRGDLVWIAEADDVAAPQFLRELAPAFADETLALAFSQSRQIDGDGRVLAPDYLDYTRDISDAWTADYIHDGRDEIAGAMAVKNVIPNVSAALFRRTTLLDAFDAIGEALFEYRIAGDWVVYMQVLLRGKVYFNASALNDHRRHGDSVTMSGKARLHYDEVARTQALARKLASVTPATRARADAHLDHVAAYLGVPEDERTPA